jgi:hypothetical protein
MPSTEPKFLLISTNGFCPLFDTGDSAARKQLESQLKELAKGSFHDKVGPDASLKGKSPEDFLAMIAKGEIGFMEATPKNSALKPRIAYSADGMPSLSARRKPASSALTSPGTSLLQRPQCVGFTMTSE